MKNLLCALLFSGVSCLFSFNKIPDRIIYIDNKKNFLNKENATLITVINLSKNKGLSLNRCFSINTDNDFLIKTNLSNQQLTFQLKNQLLELEDDNPTYTKSDVNSYLSKRTIDFYSCDSLLNTEGSMSCYRKILYKEYSRIIRMKEFFCIRSQKISVVNGEQEVRLVGLDGKSISFQKALLAYMQRYQDFNTRFGQCVLMLQEKISSQNEAKLIQKMLNESTVDYTEDQIELLRNSDILAIWFLPEKILSNKKYIMHEKTNNPNFVRREKSKVVNNVIVGLAYDKKQKFFFNWSVDLGLNQDISVLFDYSS